MFIWVCVYMSVHLLLCLLSWEIEWVLCGGDDLAGGIRTAEWQICGGGCIEVLRRRRIVAAEVVADMDSVGVGGGGDAATAVG